MSPEYLVLYIYLFSDNYKLKKKKINWQINIFFLSLQNVSNSVQVVFITCILTRPTHITKWLLRQMNPLEEMAPQFLQW